MSGADTMNLLLLFTGAITWILLGIIGMLWLIDNSIEWFIDGYNLRKEFFEWYSEKLKKKHGENYGG